MYRKQHAFTLIELLVVIAIVGLLVAIVLPSLSRARDSANQIKSLSNVRQLIVGYTAYQEDYQGHVMWGYPPDQINGQLTQVKAADGTTIVPLLAKRYPWRLIPYVENVWQVVHTHNAGLDTSDHYNLSIDPAYGINSYYVGGDYEALGFDSLGGTNYKPRYSAHAVFYNHEVKHTARLLVFGDSQQRTNATIGDTSDQGYHRVMPPKAKVDWVGLQGNQLEALLGTVTGVPRGRYGFGVATAFFDGHVASMSADELMDMRYWANHATTADYDF